MSQAQSFESRLRAKLREQICGRNVGYLLGAGASYLNGRGFPLAGGLWPAISDGMQPGERGEIEHQFEEGALNIEAALDRLDASGSGDMAVRTCVVTAIAGQRSAIIYTLLECCKRRGINPPKITGRMIPMPRYGTDDQPSMGCPTGCLRRTYNTRILRQTEH